MSAYLAAVAVFAGWAVLPGLAIAALVGDRSAVGETEPGGGSPERFTAVALASGLTVWLLGGALLARIGVLSGGVVATLASVLGAASSVVLVARVRRRRRDVNGDASVRDTSRHESVRFSAWCALAVLPGAVPLVAMVVRRRDSLISPTPWYYWDLVRQTVAAHAVPAHSVEWGRAVAFLDDYPAFTGGAALLAAVAGSGSLATAQVIRVVAILATGLGAFLLARAWGASRAGATVATIAMFAIAVVVAKLSSFRPEALAYPLLFVLPALMRRWLRTREPAVLAVLAVAFGTLGLVHGVVWLLAVVLLVATALSDVPGRESLGTWARDAALAGLAAAAAWLATSALTGGLLSGAGKLHDLPQVRDGVDPTWQFTRAVLATTLPHPPSAPRMATDALERGFIGLGRWWLPALTFAVLAVLVVRLLTGRDRGSRLAVARAVAFGILALAGSAVVVVAFALGWDTYVPRRTGASRVLQLMPLLLVVWIGVAASEAVGARLARASARWVLPTIGGVVILAVLVHGWPATTALVDQQPSRPALESLRALGLPRGSTVLTNAYAEGIVAVTTDGDSVLQGRAPYTDAPLLTRANTLLRRSASFLAGPLAPRAALPCAGITYLVLTRGGWDLGTPFVMPTDFGALDLRPDLRLVHADDHFRVYRVLPGAPVAHPLIRCS